MERLNYHHLYLFWVLSQEGTFTGAAIRLGIAQSAVTTQIKALESLLGLNLVDRTNKRRPILTEDGKAVLSFANSIFEQGDELLKWAKRGQSRGARVFRVGALSGLSRNFQFEFLRPLVGLLDISIEVVTGDQDKMVRLLREHYLDIILSSHNVSGEGRTAFYSYVLKASPLVFVVHRKFFVKHATLADYLADRGLCIPGSSFEVRPEIDAYLETIKNHSRIPAQIDDVALLRIFALNSNYVVLVPQLGVKNEIQSGELRIIAQPKGLEQKYYAISRQKRTRHPLVSKLLTSFSGAS